MRELTKEERKLAPEWATHYIVDQSDYVLFESEKYFRWLIDGVLRSVAINHEGLSSHALEIRRSKKPFDITKHEWSDELAYIDTELHKDRGGIIIDGEINRDDAIAIAKHFGLTEEDLK